MCSRIVMIGSEILLRGSRTDNSLGLIGVGGWKAVGVGYSSVPAGRGMGDLSDDAPPHTNSRSRLQRVTLNGQPPIPLKHPFPSPTHPKQVPTQSLDHLKGKKNTTTKNSKKKKHSIFLQWYYNKRKKNRHTEKGYHIEKKKKKYIQCSVMTLALSFGDPPRYGSAYFWWSVTALKTNVSMRN